MPQQRLTNEYTLIKLLFKTKLNIPTSPKNIAGSQSSLRKIKSNVIFQQGVFTLILTPQKSNLQFNKITKKPSNKLTKHN